MPITLEWSDITLRLVLTLVAGAVLGIDRSERGRPAGLRTTMLVCLAASVAMIQANLLLTVRGKETDSFAVMDLMRLPLGILTGMGFIGAGAIVRKGNRTEGITTAATLWSVTVIGLCMGGGQIKLGLVALAACMVVLSGLRWLEPYLEPGRQATLIVNLQTQTATEPAIETALAAKGYTIVSKTVNFRVAGAHRGCTFRWRLRSRKRQNEPAGQTPPFVAQLAQEPGVMHLHWES